MMMYGSNQKNNDEEIGVESSYGYRLFNVSVKDIANGQLTPAATETDANTDQDKTDSPTLTWQEIVKNFNKVYGKLVRKRTEKLVDKTKIALNKIVTYPFDGEEVASNNRYPILPLKLSVTIDGIGGIRFGNAIDIDYKPERYSDCYFQITNVSQTINSDGWETSIETVMRTDNKGIKNSTLGLKQSTLDEVSNPLWRSQGDSSGEYEQKFFKDVGLLKSQGYTPQSEPDYDIPESDLDIAKDL